MDITTFAKQFNVDPSALACLLEFLRLNIAENETFRAAFLDEKTRDMALRAAVKAWRDKSVTFYTELMENKTERAQLAREEIARETWELARRRQGLPTE